MCYDVSFLTKKKLKYAERFGTDIQELKDIEKEIQQVDPLYYPRYHTSGFLHEPIPVITNDLPHNLQFFKWGLIPKWVKDLQTAQKMAKKCINAKGETLFEKPSFKASAKKRRCMIMVDGFFEHYHYKGNTYPFFITLKSGDPFCLAGLWEKWHLPSENITEHTCSVVTTKANNLLKKIHNNPKIEEPRMPVILPKETERNWLLPDENSINIKQITEMIKPYEDNELIAWPVPKIRGKKAIGNTPQANEYYEYPELKEIFEDPVLKG